MTPGYLINLIRDLILKIANRDRRKKHVNYPYMITNVVPCFHLKNWAAIIFNSLSSIMLAIGIIILRPHIVVISTPPIESVLGAYLGAKCSKSMIIIDIRDPSEDYLLKRSSGITKLILALLKKTNIMIYRKSNITITVTKSLSRYLMRYGIKALPILNGADTRKFKPLPKELARKYLNIPQDSFVLVYAGLIGIYYKLDTILYALRDLGSHLLKKVRLLILGSGPDVEALMTTIHKLNLKENVTYLGIVNDIKKLILTLSASDIGLIPIIADPILDFALPVKLYEYIACGLPILATTSSNSELAKFIEKHKIGLICEPQDKECLTNALKNMLENKINLIGLKRNTSKLRGAIDRRHEVKKLYMLIKSYT